jgi:hypothetical protein
VGPSPHDRHPFHEQVSRGVLAAVAAAGAPHTLWLWSLWGDVELPSLAVELTDARLAEIEHALAAHEGELERTDFRRLLRGRGAANAVAGAERIFGFAAPSLAFEYAELLMELRLVDSRWRLCEPRVLDGVATALDGRPSEVDLTEWLEEPSLSTRFGSRHA